MQQTVKFYHKDLGISSFQEVPVTDLGEGLYKVADANNLKSTGRLKITEHAKGSHKQKIGVWESPLPDGGKIVKEYLETGGNIFREPIYNPLSGEPSSEAVWIDQGLATRQEFNANGELVDSRDFIAQTMFEAKPA